MSFALQLLLVPGFWGTSSMCGLKVTDLELVMVSIIVGRFTGTLLWNANSTMPNLSDAG